jgi:hypothetical protein
MELKEFVASSLTQIIEGIKQAQSQGAHSLPRTYAVQ